MRLSEQNVRANAESIAGYLGLTPDERPITSLPLHYSFGLSVLNSHLLAGAVVVLSGDSVLQRPFWDAFRAHGCTSLAGVPFTYQMLERVGFRDMDLPTLTTLQQAGGALDLHLTRVYAEHMARLGRRFFVMYGQTEATARIAYVPPERLLDKLGSAGIAIPAGRLRIDADESASRAARSTGEIIYEGPNVMLGYASDPDDLRRGDDLHGVLRTGDIGYLDEDGFLFLVGRSKRIAKVFGLRVNLDEVEVALRESGPAAVVGGSDAIWAFCAFGTNKSSADLAQDARSPVPVASQRPPFPTRGGHPDDGIRQDRLLAGSGMDDELERLLDLEQYSLAEHEKEAWLRAEPEPAHRSPRAAVPGARAHPRCREPGAFAGARLDEVPYLPVSLFKWIKLASVPDEEIFKVMTSSGTTSQVPSRIYLDIETARLQTRAAIEHRGPLSRPTAPADADRRSPGRDRRPSPADRSGGGDPWDAQLRARPLVRSRRRDAA